MIKITKGTRLTLAVVASLAAALAGAPAAAQQFPNKPLRFVHHFTAGSGTDIINRPIMERLSAELGQTVVIDARPGGGGMVAANHVKSLPPDGYVFLMASTSLMTKSVIPSTGIDARRDFTPISPSVASTLVLVVNTEQTKATTLREFIEEARAKPGQINYASFGVGSAAHVFMELLLYTAQVKMVHVPYQGSAQAITDTVAGRVAVTVGLPSMARPHVVSGKFRALAVTTAERSPLTPEVPGLREAGYAQADMPLWSGFVAPAGTPRNVVDILNRAMQATNKDPKIVEWLTKQGQIPQYGSPDDLARMISTDMDNLTKLIKDTGLKLE